MFFVRSNRLAWSGWSVAERVSHEHNNIRDRCVRRGLPIQNRTTTVECRMFRGGTVKTEEGNSSRPTAVATGRERPYRRRWLSTWALIDPVLWVPALVVAIWLRYEYSIESTVAAIKVSNRVVVAFVLIVGVQTVTGYITGLYRGRCVRDSPRELVMIGAVAA